MKLLNFSTLPSIINLKQQMGLKHSAEGKFDLTISKISSKWIKTPYNIEDLKKTQPGTVFTHNGRNIVVYIRDSVEYNFIPNINTWSSNYKIHLTWCKTLQTMLQKRQYDKYIGTDRNDGLFETALIYNNKVVIEKEQPLAVCKCCLYALNYKGYKYAQSIEKVSIYNSFSVEEFLRSHDTSFAVEPKRTENTAKHNVYSDDFPEIARSFKRRARYICAKCHTNCSKNPSLLDVHHINGDKSDNNPYNLKVLCIKCHSEEHAHYKNSTRWKYWLANKHTLI